MKLYISGAISSDLGNYRDKFAAAEVALAFAGYCTVNPAALELPDYPGDEPRWLDYMRRDVHELVECDGVALLPDWSSSPGARVEATLAEGLGLAVAPLDAWLQSSGR